MITDDNLLMHDDSYPTEKVPSTAVQLQTHICGRLPRHHPCQTQWTNYKWSEFNHLNSVGSAFFLPLLTSLYLSALAFVQRERGEWPTQLHNHNRETRDYSSKDQCSQPQWSKKSPCNLFTMKYGIFCTFFVCVLQYICLFVTDQVQRVLAHSEGSGLQAHHAGHPLPGCKELHRHRQWCKNVLLVHHKANNTEL